MAFTPSTLQGDALVGALTDTYSAVPNGLVAGQVFTDRIGRRYKFIKNGEASASITVNTACVLDGSTTDDFAVIKAVSGEANTQQLVCIPTTTITFGKFGWATVAGRCDQSTTALFNAGSAPADDTFIRIFGNAKLDVTTTAGQFIGFSKNGELWLNGIGS